MHTLAILLIAATSVAAEKPALLVMDMRAEAGVSESAARLLNELIIGEYETTGRYRVLGGSDLRTLLTNEQPRDPQGRGRRE